MTTTKKAKAKKRKAPADGAPREPQVLKEPTLVHLTYQKEAGIVRATVQQDVTIAGITQRHGRDVDLQVADLNADILSALDDAFNWIAEDVDAKPYESEE